MVWKKTGVALGAFPTGSMREVHVEGTSILLAHVGEGVYGLQSTCPHAGGILANGTLAGPRLTCPEHSAAYDVTTGAVVADPDGIEPPQGGVDPPMRYATRTMNGMIEVDVPEP